ncbi:MAG: hypothetical protein ABIJ59_13645 [Pseudomonadota bacterium]
MIAFFYDALVGAGPIQAGSTGKVLSNDISSRRSPSGSRVSPT